MIIRLRGSFDKFWAYITTKATFEFDEIWPTVTLICSDHNQREELIQLILTFAMTLKKRTIDGLSENSETAFFAVAFRCDVCHYAN